MFTKGFPQDKKITYAGIFWLLSAQIVVMLPLLFHLPLWIIPVLVFSSGWRLRVMQGHASQPTGLVKLFVAILGLIALSVSGLPLISLDMMASLLMLGFAYKALEVVQQRDGIVVILTGYLLVGVQFLYSQSMLSALYAVLSLAVLTAAMIAIQQSKSSSIKSNLKLASAMLALCLPFMLLLFMFAPRFSPLWVVALPINHPTTGISDSMTPGDIANLSQSDALAFRVSFKGKRPVQNELYWRGLVLQYFDGKTWTQFANHLNTESIRAKLSSSQRLITERIDAQGDVLQYEVIYERSAQPWLFALSPVVKVENDAALYGSDFRIMARQNIIEPLLLNLTSIPQALREPERWLSGDDLALQLPDKGNPKSLQLAQRLLGNASSNEDYIQRVLKRYRQQDFYYTLRPPAMDNANSIDDFLFEQKKGFCAHYAGSFVYMMRAAGIPARVIVGYQGGEWNEKGRYLSVYQYDAHAWTEVWLENKGWVRIDPTSMVAPERIETNLQTAMQAEGSFLEQQLLSSVKYHWLAGIRKQIDSSQYAWRKFVLGYDQNAQSDLMRNLFGNLSLINVAWIIAGLFLVIILAWSFLLGLTKKGSTEAIQHLLYRRFCDLLEQHGVKRELSQSAMEFSVVASTQIPILATEIRHFSLVYNRLCYEPDDHHSKKQHIVTLKKLIKIIKN
jgi:transglutaminase-like putative cysteine protease